MRKLIATIKEIREYNDPHTFEKEFSTHEEINTYIKEQNKDVNANFILLKVI